MAGRRPTPTHLKLVTGNPGKRPLNRQEPTPQRSLPSPPAYLSKDACAAYGRLSVLLDGMGVLTEADALALARLADLQEEIASLRQTVEREGRVYETTTETGSTIFRPRPEVAMLADADRRFRAYLIEFGLTPAARSKVRMEPNGATQDPAAEFIAG
jgi:P27 family predicted phage terminase small subunit